MSTATDTAEVWHTWAADLRRYVEKRAERDAVPDLLQEISIRVHQHLASLRDEDRVAPWVFRIARNVVTDHLRRHRPTAALPDDLVEEPSDDRASTVPLALWLGSALHTLPPRYREALTLTDVQGLSQREAADQLGLSYSGFKSRVQRGRARLRELLRQCCEVELGATGGVIDYRPVADCCCQASKPDSCS